MNTILSHRNHKLRRAQAESVVRACSLYKVRVAHRHRRAGVRNGRLQPVAIHSCGIIHITTRGNVAYGQVPA